MGAIYGGVLSQIRRDLQLTQQQLAEQLHWPPSVLSKIEAGAVTIGAHHLDAIAAALTILERERRPHAEERRGWQLHRLADEVAEAIAKRAFTVLWTAPDDAWTDGLLVDQRELALMIRESLAAPTVRT